MNKNRAVSVFKGIAILGVVAHHLANRRFAEPMRGEIGWLGGVMDWVVPAFILASGYLHGLSHARKPVGFGSFMMSRGRRLMLPFVITGVVYGMIYAALITTGLLSDPNGPRDMAWWQRCWACLTFQPGGVGEQLYFFPLLFMVSAAALIFLTAIRHGTKGVFAGAAGMFALAVLMAGTKAGDYSFVWPMDRLAYVIGLYLLGFGLSAQKQKMAHWVWAGAGVVALLCILGRFPLVQFVIPVLLLAGLLALNARWSPLERVGEAAGTIFLYHTPFVLQPLLIVVAAKFPTSVQVAGAYMTGLGVVIGFTALHTVLVKGRFKWMAI